MSLYLSTTVLRTTCPTCDGEGVHGAGRQTGPDDYERTVRCETCFGYGMVDAQCAGCLEPYAKVLADGVPWCQECRPTRERIVIGEDY